MRERYEVVEDILRLLSLKEKDVPIEVRATIGRLIDEYADSYCDNRFDYHG